MWALSSKNFLRELDPMMLPSPLGTRNPESPANWDPHPVSPSAGEEHSEGLATSPCERARRTVLWSRAEPAERAYGTVSRNRAKPGGVLRKLKKKGRNPEDGRWLAEPTWHAVGRADVVQAAAKVGWDWCDVGLGSALISLQRDTNQKVGPLRSLMRHLSSERQKGWAAREPTLMCVS